MLLFAKASPISMIGRVASLVVTVTSILMEAPHAPAASELPTLNATRFTSARLAGGVFVQSANKGVMVSGEVVYSVPAGKVCPLLSAVPTGIGAMMKTPMFAPNGALISVIGCAAREPVLQTCHA